MSGSANNRPPRLELAWLANVAAACITRGIETLHDIAEAANRAATPPERPRLYLPAKTPWREAAA